MNGYRLAIVGAGPAGMACAVAAVHGGLVSPDELVVVDPAGEWLACWRAQLRAVDASFLRSPTAYHPAPDPMALHQFVVSSGGTVARLDSVMVPTVSQFNDFCASVVDRYGLADRVVAGALSRTTVEGPESVLELASGARFAADRVVLAHNPRVPRLPGWGRPSERVLHSSGVDLAARAPMPGRVVVVVGGGLTAAMLALGAARRGARVTLLARRPLSLRRFDAAPGWLAPRSLQRFLRLGQPEERVAASLEARRGGSLPASVGDEIRHAGPSHGVEVREGCEIVAVVVEDDGLSLRLGDGSTQRADELWLATGFAPDLADPLVAQVAARTPAGTAGGFPDLDEHLAWPGTSTHLVGALATSRLGPTAGNLHGHRWAAQLVAQAAAGPRTSVRCA